MVGGRGTGTARITYALLAMPAPWRQLTSELVTVILSFTVVTVDIEGRLRDS